MLHCAVPQVRAYYQAEQAALNDNSFWKDPDNLAAVMETEIFGALEPRGSGERHVKLLPRIPRFRVRSLRCCTCGLPWKEGTQGSAMLPVSVLVQPTRGTAERSSFCLA